MGWWSNTWRMSSRRVCINLSLTCHFSQVSREALRQEITPRSREAVSRTELFSMSWLNSRALSHRKPKLRRQQTKTLVSIPVPTIFSCDQTFSVAGTKLLKAYELDNRQNFTLACITGNASLLSWILWRCVWEAYIYYFYYLLYCMTFKQLVLWKAEKQIRFGYYPSCQKLSLMDYFPFQFHFVRKWWTYVLQAHFDMSLYSERHRSDDQTKGCDRKHIDTAGSDSTTVVRVRMTISQLATVASFASGIQTLIIVHSTNLGQKCTKFGSKPWRSWCHYPRGLRSTTFITS